MSRNKESGSGGDSIIPSARPSIHRYRSEEWHQQHGENRVMGTFGLNDGKQRARGSPSTSASNQSVDETDGNVQSKFKSPSSPKPVLRKRNSLDGSSERVAFMTQSLPSRLYNPNYSDDESQIPQWSQNTSAHSNRSFQGEHMYEEERVTNQEIEAILAQERVRQRSRGRSQESKSNISPWVWLCLPIVVVIFGFYFGPVSNLFNSDSYGSPRSKYTVANFYNDLNNLRKKFHMRDNSILQLKTAISTISERQDTGSFILAYKSNKKDFNYDDFYDMINTISSKASKYLRNESMLEDPVVLYGSELQMRTHEELINKYKEDVDKTGVLLVRDVNEVPSAVAMAFHYYCDEYNPLVKKSAIFFTLDMAKCSQNPAEQKPTHAQIEKCLENRWRGVHKDKIAPLLSRIVNTVVDVSGDL